ncbi:MAG TPA: bifunctional riboflavin kinase/FAD synthetase [Actinomycetota bacterium]|nr:bifunctional riboflavin kinase/FAD synthetase [Actinomycetota bacterium]
MQVVHALHGGPDPSGVALTIGNFDGVHRGHRAILGRLLELAAATGAAPTVLTFDPHPQAVLRGHAPLALSTFDRRMALLAEAGIERVVVLPFDRELSLVEPEDFGRDVLAGRLGVRAIVVGSNFRFGHKARGDVAMLASLGEAAGFSVETVTVGELEGRRLSSTEIRTAIRECDVAWAAKALGRPHLVPGRIVRGKGRGVSLGFPTANIEPPEGFCLPGLGIYAGHLLVEGQRLVSAISVGTNPTFGDNPISLEAYALDFEGDLYGEEGGIEFAAWLRAEEAFPDAEALSAAIDHDVAEVRRLLGVS